MPCFSRKSFTDSATKGFAVGERISLCEARLPKRKPKLYQRTDVGLGFWSLPLLVLDSEGCGLGVGIGQYDFFAFMAPTRSEKLSH
jgi:hypothetical protein